MTKPPAIICDIDGTIALLGDRSPHDLEHVSEDKLNKPVYQLLILYYTYYRINFNIYPSERPALIFVTGREERSRLDTENWLLNNGLPFKYLYMRPDGDRQLNVDLKLQVLNNVILPVFEPILALEDDYRVARMYRDNGVPCFQVAETEFKK